jgi:hypothetical protein
MTRRGRLRPESLRLIAPRNSALTPAREWLNIWKACTGTITVMSRTNSLWSVIWFYERRRQKDCINEHRIGRALTWSRLSLGLLLIGCVISTESTSQICCILTTLGAITLDSLLRKICALFVPQVFNKCFIVFLLPSLLYIAISPKFLVSGLPTSFFSYLSFLVPTLSLTSPHTCMRPVHYVPGGR